MGDSEPLTSWPLADWRLLLPLEPGCRVAFVPAATAAERRVLVEAGATVLDLRERTSPASVDVLVVEGGHDVDASLPALAPGGFLLERLDGGPLRRLRRSVSSRRSPVRHLRRIVTLWHAPRRSRCSYVVDTRDRTAVDAMLRRFAGVRFGRVKSLVARGLNAVGAVALLAADVTVVSQRLDGAEPPRSLGLLPRELETELAPPGIPLSRLLITPWFEASRHVIGLYLHSGRGTPLAVAKVPRRPWDVDGIAHEAEVLDRLASTDRADGRAPRVRGVSLAPRPYLLEDALIGTPAGPELVRSSGVRLLEAAVALVDGLPLTGSTSDESDWFQRLLVRPLHEVRDRVALPEVEGLVHETLDRLDPLASARLPFVLEHGDLSHPNLMLDRDVLRAVDWERSEIHGLPGHDLCFFLQYVAESRRRTFERHGQRLAFDDAFTHPDGWALPWLRRHLAHRGVDPRLLPSLILATFARSSASLLPRVAANARTPGGDATAGLVAAAFAEDRDFALWSHAARRFLQLGT